MGLLGNLATVSDFALGFWTIIERTLLDLYARESLNIQYFPLGYFGRSDTLVSCRPAKPKGERGALSHANWKYRQCPDAGRLAAEGAFLVRRRRMDADAAAGSVSATSRSQEAPDRQFHWVEWSCGNLGASLHQQHPAGGLGDQPAWRHPRT